MNMFPHTVTVYNKYKDGKTEKWQRTVLRGVYWNAIKGAVTRKTGVSSADSLMLMIPRNARSDRAYKPSSEWAVLSDKAGFWTLQNGDTVVKGELVYEVESSTKELEAFDNVRLITSIDYHDVGGNMAHWEVGGK